VIAQSRLQTPCYIKTMSNKKKRRNAVPDDIAAEVLFAADYTCCVCRDANRFVQLHHIDENSANHNRVNLAPLCLIDHNRTLLGGGFGRHLSASAVRRYLDDWLNHVTTSRKVAATRAPETPAGPPRTIAMPLLEDHMTILRSLNDEYVKYVVFGGFAAFVYGEVTSTGDLDLWVARTEDNEAALRRALAVLGIAAPAPLPKLLRLGSRPIDLYIENLQSYGRQFATCYARRRELRVDSTSVALIAPEDNVNRGRPGTSR
jgi:hypothetical protein